MRLSRRLQISAARGFLRTIGQASTGIRLCFEFGLTSGLAVDYVYRNRPSGRWLVGSLIDRWFLSHPGWEAIRVRRRHLEQLILEAIAELRQASSPISIVDVASGPALYILSVVQQAGQDGITVVCRDLDERWLQEGRQEAGRRGVTNVCFERGDALDRQSFSVIAPRPNIAVASGFYDWLDDDGAVRSSISMIFELLEPGGSLILTSQMGHFDLELTSAVFADFNHRPLRMPLRPEALMRSWLRDAGFSMEAVLTDVWGYYAVMRARKPRPSGMTSEPDEGLVGQYHRTKEW
jgi:SAM-dependent methyltransferase